jgi:hypothetical protein
MLNNTALPTHCIYIFLLILRMNSDYFPNYNSPVAFRNGDAVVSCEIGMEILNII